MIRQLEEKSDAIINRGSVKALLHGMYPRRQHMRNRDYTMLAQDLAAADITTLGALGKLLLKGDGPAREQEHERSPLTDVAFVWLAVREVSPAFHSGRRKPRIR